MKIATLGLELRTLGSKKHLFEDVDQILSKYTSPDIQVMAVAHSLQKMIGVQSHFDVCNIRSCAKTCQINVPEERMNVYQSIHCMHWSEMKDDFRQMIIAMVLDDFRTVLNPDEQTDIIKL